MDDKKLNRVFAQVRLSPERREAMLANLLSEEREASSMKQASRRRIPGVVLAAALVLALAGTALAAEYLGWIRIEAVSSWLGPDGPVNGNGYTVTHERDRFPAEELSEEVFAIGREIGDVHHPGRMIAFDSWTACEEFLGVTLADNARLDQMKKRTMRVDGDDFHFRDIYAYVSLGYEHLMPSYATASACYREGSDILVSQSVQLRTQYAPDDVPGQWDTLIPQSGEEPPTYEAYITANGAEAVIFTSTYDTSISTYTDCYASFAKDGRLFFLDVSVKTHDSGEPTGAPDAVELTKEILDAYE